MTKRMPTILAYAGLVLALAFGFVITTAHSHEFSAVVATTVSSAQI